MRFLQLYTSKSYENRRSELVKPEDDEENNKKKHRLSPRLVETIARTTQLVWANVSSMGHDGLNGRSDIPLNTAVGMPVAIDGNGNMCVVVMFSPNDIQSTDDAVQYLQSISQSATSASIPCLLPVVDPSTVKQLPPSTSAGNTTSDGGGAFGEGVVVKCVSLTQPDGQQHEAEVTSAPKDTFGIPMLPDFGIDVLDIFDEASYGIWSTIMDTDGLWSEAVLDSMGESQEDVSSLANVVSEPALQVVLTSKASMSEPRKTRLEEFCAGFLGMSVFDVADVWVLAGDEQPDCLRYVTSVIGEDNPVLDSFRQSSVNALIKFWNGAIGHAYSSRDPVWSVNPKVFVDSARAGAFQAAQIRTVLAVPVFQQGSSTPTCIVACYSMVHNNAVPFTLKFVQQALRLLWSGLDQIEPHESLKPQVWKEVDPTDLGEMAADEEMHQHFISKKRPHSVISTVYTDSNSSAAGKLADQFRGVSIPANDSAPQNYTTNSNISSGVDLSHVRNHVINAIRSVSSAVPFQSLPTTADGSKRANIGPLQMPRGLPSNIVGAVDGKIVELPPSPPLRPKSSSPHVVQSSSLINDYQGPFHQGLNSTTNIAEDARHLLSFAALNGVAAHVPTNIPLTIDGQQLCMPTRHGSSPTCKIEGCDNPSASRRPYCAEHCGSRQCEKEGCTKCAQGATRFCIAHGGGRRCTFPGCDKGARDKRFCAAHGGGKRCSLDGCSKSAVGGSNLCTAHGGGKRCSIAGCGKSAQSSTEYCVKHGGGKKCGVEGCTKVARGRTNFCASHGGGVRCKLEHCNKVAIGKMQLCRAHGGYSSRSVKRVPTTSPL